MQVKLRIAPDLKRRLDREASKRLDGSLSAEIAERLEWSFEAPGLRKTVHTAIAEELKSVNWPTGTQKKGGKE